MIRLKETNNVERQSDRLSAVSCVTRKAVVYHWRELPQVSNVLSRQGLVCGDKTRLLLRQKFVATNTCSSRQKNCHDKHTFVASKDVFCCHQHVFVTKEVSLSRVATKHVFSRDKHVLVATKIILMAAPANDKRQLCV